MDRYEDALARQRRFFQTGATLSLGFRLAALKRLRDAMKRYEPQLLEALQEDLGKAPFEAYATELGVVYEEISEMRRNLRDWMRPRAVKSPLAQFPSRCAVFPEPLGVSLIISPWNYPVQLTLAPLAAALAAGNCAVVKPSRYAARTALVLDAMLRAAFPPYLVTVFQGGAQVNTALLELKFDHIFFTGSPAVGRVVMEAAARHLTPVTLELGGKSPCIVDETANPALAARRIAWGKLLNAGQTCVAPDYALVHESVFPRFVEEYIRAVGRMYGEEPMKNPEYGKIINEKHMERLKSLLGSGTPLLGGVYSDRERKISPTLLTDTGWDSPVMQEEIFGPILPVLPYRNFSAMLEQLKDKPSPLALYIFSENREHQRRALREVRFGGGCVNDVVVHLTNPRMPFGGVGESGMGAYHGKAGFLAFSHEKGILKKSARLDLPVRYAPYRGKLSLARLLMR